MRLARLAGWTGACALVVLASRALCYALAPHPGIVAGHLESRLGGPRLVVVATVAIVAAAVLAASVLWLVSIAVQERLALSPAPVVDPPRISVRRLFARSLLLALVSSTAFALLESYIHWRAGLGWHGVHCLVGPVHRDVLPFLGSLSLVAAAVAAALEHLLAWMRRTIVALLARTVGAHGRRPAARRTLGSVPLRPRLRAFGASPRGPPVPRLLST
jgi:hypothetical protein